jgi:hypothetical protein
MIFRVVFISRCKVTECSPLLSHDPDCLREFIVPGIADNTGLARGFPQFNEQAHRPSSARTDDMKNIFAKSID